MGEKVEKSIERLQRADEAEAEAEEDKDGSVRRIKDQPRRKQQSSPGAKPSKDAKKTSNDTELQQKQHVEDTAKKGEKKPVSLQQIFDGLLQTPRPEDTHHSPPPKAQNAQGKHGGASTMRSEDVQKQVQAM